MGAIDVIAGKWTRWREQRRAPALRLVEDFRTPRTPVERLAVAELTRPAELTFAALAKRVTHALVRQAIARGEWVVDVGLWGPIVFSSAVERELQSLHGVLWQYARPRAAAGGNRGQAVARLGAVVGLVVALVAPARAGTVELLNVSYDPTRGLWRDLNRAFVAEYEKRTGQHLIIRQSHGGSSSQARAVIDGLDADVVSLALFADVDAIRQRGLIKEGWETRLPHRSAPYTSTIVFAVRQGNPKRIRDWPDLVAPGITIVTPNPKTSGNGKLSLLAAWGAVTTRGGSEREAVEFVTRLYRQAPVLDSGARGAAITFVQKKIGDVHLVWEDEAVRDVEGGRAAAVEIVYPPVSILAEPHVAVVDVNVDRRGTRTAAEAYLRYLYTDAAQEIIAAHHYRPVSPAVLRKHGARFPAIKLFPVSALVKDWREATDKFFADGKLVDRIFQNQ